MGSTLVSSDRAKYQDLPIFRPNPAVGHLIVQNGDPALKESTFKVFKSPLFGSDLGESFDYPAAATSNIKEIVFSSKDYLEAVQVRYYHRDAVPVGDFGHKKVISLMEGEHIIGLSGYASDVVYSFEIKTTTRNLTFGASKQGNAFQFACPENSRIVGFFGTYSDGKVRSIGANYAKIPRHASGQLVRRNSSSTSVVSTALPAQMLLNDDLYKVWGIDPNVVDQAKNDAQYDLSPLYAYIGSQGPSAFNVCNTTEGNSTVQYYCLVGNNNASVWIYPTNITNPDNSTSIHVQIGSYSPSSGLGGVSSHIVDGVAGAVGLLTVGSAFVNWFSQYITRINEADSIVDDSLSVESQAAEAGEFLGEAVGEEAAVDVAASAAAFPVGTIAIAVTIAVAVVFYLLSRTYTLGVNVYNFDSNSSRAVSQYVGDNAVVSGDQWSTIILRPVTHSIPGPFGPIQSPDNIIEYVTYVFVNDFTILDGIGIAMAVETDTYGSGRGFMFGYLLSAVEDNSMALTPGIGNLEDFYDDHSSWPETLFFQGQDDSGLPVLMDTNALGGQKNNSYTVDINIDQTQ